MRSPRSVLGSHAAPKGWTGKSLIRLTDIMEDHHTDWLTHTHIHTNVQKKTHADKYTTVLTNERREVSATNMIQSNWHLAGQRYDQIRAQTLKKKDWEGKRERESVCEMQGEERRGRETRRWERGQPRNVAGPGKILTLPETTQQVTLNTTQSRSKERAISRTPTRLREWDRTESRWRERVSEWKTERNMGMIGDVCTWQCRLH